MAYVFIYAYVYINYILLCRKHPLQIVHWMIDVNF